MSAGNKEGMTPFFFQPYLICLLLLRNFQILLLYLRMLLDEQVKILYIPYNFGS